MRRYSIRIVEKVAEKEGIAPTELDYILDEAVDSTALDQVMQSLDEAGQGAAGVLTFEFCGYTVRVSSDGAVDIQ